MLKLPLLAHPFADVLLTYVWMCAKGGILGANSKFCISSAPSSTSFIFTSPLGFKEDTRRAWVAWEKGELQTKYCLYGYWHTPTIPDPDALVVPIHDWEKGSSSRR